MARLFDDGASEYLEVASAVVTVVPVTLAAWFNADDLSATQDIMNINRSDVLGHCFRLLYALGTDSITAIAKDGAVTGRADSLAAPGVDTWHHAAGVFTNNAARAVFLDGGNKDTDATDTTPVGLDRTTIGVFHNAGNLTGYMSGMIAEAGIWNAALTDAEVAILAAGYSPLLVRPQSLVAYWPLIRDTDDDIVGGYSMTPVNGPTVGPHAPVLYAVGPQAPERVAIPAEVVWGHDTAVTEEYVRNFHGSWTGTGAIDNQGVADDERLALNTTEYMISEVVNTGAVDITIEYNVYQAGDAINLDYRHGATVAACEGAGWNDYAAAFTSAGFVQVRVTSTL